MGADLYTTPLYEKQRQQWEPEFEKAASLRDSVTQGTEEHRQAQARVETCYEKIYERGYFRDPYNDHDLLWKFGLSWWTDVIPMLDDKSQLSVEQADLLLAMLKERHNIFQLKLAPLSAEERRRFLDRYADLQKFLNEAIELNTPIDASL